MSNALTKLQNEQDIIDQKFGLYIPDNLDKQEKRVWLSFFELIRYIYINDLSTNIGIKKHIAKFRSLNFETKKNYNKFVFSLIQEQETQNSIIEEYLAYKDVTNTVNKVAEYLTADQTIQLIEQINEKPLDQEAKDFIIASKQEGLNVTEDDIQYLADTATQRYVGRDGLRIDNQGTRAAFTNSKPLTMEDLGRYIETGQLGELDEEDVEQVVSTRPPASTNQPPQNLSMPIPPRAVPQQVQPQGNQQVVQNTFANRVQQAQPPIVAPINNKPLPSTAANLRQANRTGQDLNTVNQANPQNPNIPVNRNHGLDDLLK